MICLVNMLGVNVIFYYYDVKTAFSKLVCTDHPLTITVWFTQLGQLLFCAQLRPINKRLRARLCLYIHTT